MTHRLIPFAFASLLVACANTAILPNAQPPAQVAARVCPIVQTTIVSLQVLDLGVSSQASLATAATAVTTICALGSKISTGNLQSLAGNALPAIVDAIQASTLSAEKKKSIVLDLAIAQILLSGALALNPPLTSIGTDVPAAAASSPK